MIKAVHEEQPPDNVWAVPLVPTTTNSLYEETRTTPVVAAALLSSAWLTTCCITEIHVLVSITGSLLLMMLETIDEIAVGTAVGDAVGTSEEG